MQQVISDWVSMHPLISIATSVVFGFIAGWLLKVAHVQDRTAAIIQQQSGDLTSLALRLNEVTADLQAARLLAQNETERRVQVVEMIAVGERATKQWQKMYHDQGVGASVAQSMLMAEITRLSGLLRKYDAKKATISPACVSLVDQLAADHKSDQTADKETGDLQRDLPERTVPTSGSEVAS